jgi:large subunit ribosomal protein L29
MDRAELYHNMTTPELNEKLLSLKQEMFNLRFQHSTGQLKNPLMLKTVKKDYARVITVLKERELQLPKNPGKGKKVVKKQAASKTEAKVDEKKTGGNK